MMADEDCLQRQILVVIDSGFFIPGPAIVESVNETCPMCRCFGFDLMRSRGTLPQSKVVRHSLAGSPMAQVWSRVAPGNRTPTPSQIRT